MKAHQGGSLFSIAGFFFSPNVSSLKADNFDPGGRSLRKAGVIAIGLVALSMMAGVAFGQATWTGATSTDWFTNSHWSTGNVPRGGRRGHCRPSSALSTDREHTGRCGVHF